jgi:hypothetical protein
MPSQINTVTRLCRGARGREQLVISLYMYVQTYMLTRQYIYTSSKVDMVPFSFIVSF